MSPIECLDLVSSILFVPQIRSWGESLGLGILPGSGQLSSQSREEQKYISLSFPLPLPGH